MSIWKKFSDERPWGKLLILLTDGKHLGYMHTYKQDWLKEWDNEDPNIAYYIEEKCLLCCHDNFKPTHWASGWEVRDLL